MARNPDQTTEQLTTVTARLERLARRQRGGPLGGFRPFVLGALVGAGAALLYAPQAGEQTRALLRRNASDVQASTTASVQTAKQKLQGGTAAVQDSARRALAQAAGTAKATVQDGRAETSAVVRDADQAAQDGGEQARVAADTAADEAVGARERPEREAARPEPV
jgi:gas vesicle protein